MPRLPLVVFCALLPGVLVGATPTITALVSCPPVPPGGTAQITVMLASPVNLTHGQFQIDLDPGVFGPISAVNVFSAGGDQQGAAKLRGLHADVVFGSESGGVGRLPGVPLAEITAPVLGSAAAGLLGAVTVQSSSVWHEVSGRQYSVTFESAGIPIGPGIAIASVVPGGGWLADGTVVAIHGQGFTPDMKLQLDGVAWSNLQVIGSTLAYLTLSGAADLTGKLFRLTTTDGAEARYWSALTPTSLQDENHSGYWPIFPAIQSDTTGVSASNYWWFENDSKDAIDVVLKAFLTPCTPCAGQPLPADKKLTLPPGGVYLANYNYSTGFPAYGAYVTASAPLRILRGMPPQAPIPFSDQAPNALSPDIVIASGGWCLSGAIDYRQADPAPQPIACELPSGTGSVGSLVAGTDDGNPWLRISPVSGSATKFTVSVDPSGLAPGLHTAILTNAASKLRYETFTVNVHPDVTIASDWSSLSFDPMYPSPVTLRVTSSSPSVPVRVTASPSWLTITPASAVTPATFSVALAPGAIPNQTGTVTVQGAGKTILIPATVNPVGVSTRQIAFAVVTGSTAVQKTTLYLTRGASFRAAADSGGTWLTASSTPTSNGGTDTLTISADPSGLTAGVYRGTVTVTPAAYTGPGTPIPVTLAILDASIPQPVVSPAVLTTTFHSPLIVPTMLSVSTGSVSLPFSVSYQGGDGINFLPWTFDATTPGQIPVYAYSTFPGTYHGSLTITAPPGSSNSVTVPVTVVSPPAPMVDPGHPTITSLVNAASLLPGAIAPGEIVSVFGPISPFGPVSAGIGSDGKINRALYAMRVLFNGVAAPLLAVSPSRIDAVVPYEIAGAASATVQIERGGALSPAWVVPTVPAAPGVYTQDGIGAGAASVLNQDSSTNTPDNPAARGSIVQIFLTGEGATNPPGVTGAITGLDTKSAAQAVTVQIGGVDAKVYSASSAPNAVAGLFQVNAEVPAAAPQGAVPIVVKIGGASSQTSATVSVQ